MEEGAAKETGDGRTLYVSVEDITVVLSCPTCDQKHSILGSILADPPSTSTWVLSWILECRAPRKAYAVLDTSGRST